MTVKFYDIGEHGAGFVGFRAMRLVDPSKHCKQKYYSLNEHSYAQAFILAHQQDKDWELEADKIKEQNRLNSNNTKTGPVVDSIKVLTEFTSLVGEAGIKSIKQLSMFLRCASQEGSCLYDILNLPLDSREYKRHYGTVRQLMLGSAHRGNDGADLLTWGEIVYGKERAVILTAGGYRLFNKIKNKLALE